MLCSNCGFDNPRDHRYCGMCGTPFPLRALTAPEAQSTLAFASVPWEIAPSSLLPRVAEPIELPTEAAPVSAEECTLAADLQWPKPVVIPEEVQAVEPHEQPKEVAAEAVAPEPVAFATSEIPPATTVEIAAEEPGAFVEAAPEILEEIEANLSVKSAEVEPEIVEHLAPEISEPEAVVEETAPREAQTEAPTQEVIAPPPRVIVMPAPRPQPIAPAASELRPEKPTVIHPSPDAQPFTPPPVSAGMPTFQEVVEAAGAPPISPFEPLTVKPADEDLELQEYIAGFRYTPPAETADELTMRSEVPVIDKEEPGEFHHPSFDDDVPPPPEAGPHPTGEEYYPPAGAGDRPRFLEISDAPSGAKEGAFPAILESAVPPTSPGKRWLWPTVAALVAFFGGLGFLEGRAQRTHAFRGPVEVVRNAYDHLRQQLARQEKPSAAATEDTTNSVKQPEATPQSAAPETAAKTQPETASLTNASGGAPAGPAAQAQAPQPQPASEAKPASGATTPDAAAKTEPAKPIQPPPAPKESAKPQPGQQEVEKAMNASDATAAAAWLWKATSRGNTVAPVLLADMYIKGSGVPRSCEQAMVLLRSAATRESAPARNRLAAMYANGTCVPRDRVKAYQLMSSALQADPTSEWAKENRRELWNQMTPQERAEAEKYR